MTFAALILFDDDDPPVDVLGVPWPDFRIRSAIRAGARHVVVVAGRITPQIVTAIDRARADGVSVALARTAIEVADLFHPDEAVLLLSGQAIVEDDLLERLLSAKQPILACVGAGGDAVWELIDARARWTGLGRIDGARVRSTAAMVGDWDLASTLLRQAVTAKAERLMLGETSLLWRADRQDERIAASRHIVRVSADNSGGWVTRFIIKPAVQAASLLAADRLAMVVKFAFALAALPLIAGVVFAWCRWPIAAALMLMFGFMTDAFGALAERAAGLMPKFRQWRRRAGNGAAVAALAGLVLPIEVDRAPLVLAVVLIALAALADRVRDTRNDPHWLADVPGFVLVIGLASVFGAVGVFAGLAAASLHAFATLAWLQNRLSRALTSTR